MKKFDFLRMACFVFVFCVAAAVVSHAQTFTAILSFDYTNGAIPWGLVQGADGNFYGTTDKGGQAGGSCNKSCGTIFKLTLGGTLTTLHKFNGTDGNGPSLGLVQASNGTFYGTASYGGTSVNCNGGDCGTAFKMSAKGALKTLLSFDNTDGATPWGALIVGTDGNFYGTTTFGGANGYGTVFKMTSAGALTTLHNFGNTDGAYPFGELVEGTDGNFYGTTVEGGTDSYGTVFKMTSAGTVTTLHSFTGSDGGYPYAGLVQALDGNFYGTASAGSIQNGPSCSEMGIGLGTIFEITSGGTFTTLHTFNGTDGSFPYAGLVQGTDGNFYGLASCGGTNGDGTIFEFVTSSGTLTTLHTLSGSDGISPFSGQGLIQATNGSFYGTAVEGGTDNYGTIFSLSVGLGPFVELHPTSGKVGTKVTILGNNLTGTTAVDFNGKLVKSFKVGSGGTEITTSVPKGATTGYVTVTTPSGTLTSNVPFQVTM